MDIIQGGVKIERFLQQGFLSDSDDERVHPTQKPTELLQRLLQDYSKPGDLELDCFMGSGSMRRPGTVMLRQTVSPGFFQRRVALPLEELSASWSLVSS